MRNYICPICGFIHVGDAAPERCPICKVPGYRFSELKSENETTDVAVHHPSDDNNYSKDVNEEAHQSMEKYYYVDSNHKQTGPVSPTDFRKFGINKDTLVWRQGMANWQLAGTLSELAPYLRHNKQPVNTQQKPDNYMIWAILATLFCCLATGIVAIVEANRVDNYWYEGKHQEAIQAMKDAKKWIFISIGIGVIGYITLALFGPSGYLFFQMLLLALWFTYTFINGIGAGASPLFAILLWIGGIIFLCWIIPVLYSFCF